MSVTYPNEAWPADTAVEALDGTTDEATGLPYIAKGTGPTSVPSYEVQYNRRQQRQNRILAGWRQGMVVDEGNLKIGVYPINFTLGGYRRFFAGATNQAVPDDSIRYVYLDESANLQIAEAWPGDLTAYLPLAKVVSSSGTLTIEDMRVYAAFHVPQIDGPADITGTPNATFHLDSDGAGPKLKNEAGVLQIRDAADAAYASIDVAGVKVGGTEAINASGEATAIAAGTVEAADLNSTLKAAIPKLTMSVGSQQSGTISVTVQVQDAAGVNLAERFVVRVWLSDSPYGAESSSGPDNGMDPTTGTLLKELTADKHQLVITDTSGQAVITIGHSSSATFYLNGELDGRIYVSEAVTFSY